MSQTDLLLETVGVGGTPFAQDVQAALRAVATWMWGPAEPVTKLPGLVWTDTSATPWVVRQRNAANDAWIALFTIDDTDDSIAMTLKALTMTGALKAVAGTVGAPGMAFSGDPDTGVYSPGANQVAIAAGGARPASFGANHADLRRSVRFSGTASPPQITADQNDYNPADLATVSYLRLQPDTTGHILTGLAGGAEGRVVIIRVTDFDLTLAHESTASAAANRFDLPGNADLSIKDDEVAGFRYDAITSRWYLIFSTSTATASGTFTSAEQTITAGGSLQIPHGLGAKPTRFECFLVCKTAEGGYSINDEVPVNPHLMGDGGGGSRGQAIVADATNINVRFGSDSAVYNLLNFGTGARFNITPANWKWIVRARI